MINSRHSIGFCNLCGCWMVICADCGNNCCNGTEGCLSCAEAYSHQDIFYQDETAITFQNTTDCYDVYS